MLKGKRDDLRKPQRILEQEVDPAFAQAMDKRVVVGYLKYGPGALNYMPGGVNALATAQKCIKKYLSTGNTEYLVDAANYMRFEFMYPQHTEAHFRGTDSDESAGTVGVPYRQMKMEVAQDA